MRVEGVTDRLTGAENLPPAWSRVVPDFRDTLASIQGTVHEAATPSSANAVAQAGVVATTPSKAAQPGQTQAAPQDAAAPAKRKGFLQAVFEGVVQAFKGIWAGLRGIFVGNSGAEGVHAQSSTHETQGVRDL